MSVTPSIKLVAGRKVWAREEDDLLRKLWPSMAGKCARRFPGRTLSAVTRRATDLGLVFERKWSQGDDDILRANYPSKGAAGCVGLFSVGRTPRAIQSRAVKLGMHIQGDRVGSATLDQDELLRLLDYNEKTGQFTWRVPVGRARPGEVASTKNGSGYTVIGIRGAIYRAHRLAWLAVYGVWPSHEIDHIDGDKSNNAIRNLRDVPRRINAQNVRKSRAMSGLLGAHFRADTGKFQASLAVDGRSLTLGQFSSAEEAHEAYLQAKRAMHEGCTI